MSGERPRRQLLRWAPNNAMANHGIGWAMVADILTGTFLWGGAGFLLDRWLGTRPWIMVGGFVVGYVVGIYAAMLHMRRMQAAKPPPPPYATAAGDEDREPFL